MYGMFVKLVSLQEHHRLDRAIVSCRVDVRVAAISSDVVDGYASQIVEVGGIGSPIIELSTRTRYVRWVRWVSRVEDDSGGEVIALIR